MDDDIFWGIDETTVAAADTDFTVARDDARAMATALAAAIEAAPAESLDDIEKQSLLDDLTDLPGWIDHEGVVRVGLWVLGTRNGKLAWMQRGMADERYGPRQYIAIVEREDNDEGWQVTAVSRERLLLRR